MNTKTNLPAAIEYGRMLAAQDTFLIINATGDSEKAKAVREVRFAINRVLDLLSREIRKAVKRVR